MSTYNIFTAAHEANRSKDEEKQIVAPVERTVPNGGALPSYNPSAPMVSAGAVNTQPDFNPNLSADGFAMDEDLSAKYGTYDNYRSGAVINSGSTPHTSTYYTTPVDVVNTPMTPNLIQYEDRRIANPVDEASFNSDPDMLRKYGSYGYYTHGIITDEYAAELDNNITELEKLTSETAKKFPLGVVPHVIDATKTPELSSLGDKNKADLEAARNERAGYITISDYLRSIGLSTSDENSIDAIDKRIAQLEKGYNTAVMPGFTGNDRALLAQTTPSDDPATQAEIERLKSVRAQLLGWADTYIADTDAQNTKRAEYNDASTRRADSYNAVTEAGKRLNTAQTANYGKGNIDISRLPAFDTTGGNSMAFPMEVFYDPTDGKYKIIPAAVPDENGEWGALSTLDAIKYYRRSGMDFGEFDTAADAQSYLPELQTKITESAAEHDAAADAYNHALTEFKVSEDAYNAAAGALYDSELSYAKNYDAVAWFKMSGVQTIEEALVKRAQLADAIANLPVGSDERRRYERLYDQLSMKTLYDNFEYTDNLNDLNDAYKAQIDADITVKAWEDPDLYSPIASQNTRVLENLEKARTGLETATAGLTETENRLGIHLSATEQNVLGEIRAVHTLQDISNRLSDAQTDEEIHARDMLTRYAQYATDGKTISYKLTDKEAEEMAKELITSRSLYDGGFNVISEYGSEEAAVKAIAADLKSAPVNMAASTARKEAKKALLAAGFTNREVDDALETISRAGNSVRVSRMQDNISAQSGWADLGTSILSVLALAPAVLGNVEAVRAGMLDTSYVSGDPNSAWFTAVNYRNAVRSATAEDIKSDAGSYLYNIAMSSADSLLAAYVGGGALLGASAAADTLHDQFEKGVPLEQAVIAATVSGLCESIFEEFSIGELRSMHGIFDTGLTRGGIKTLIDEGAITWGTLLKDFGKNLTVNFSEELNTEIANITFDLLREVDFSEAKQKMSALQLEINPLTGKFYTEAEAKSKVLSGLVDQALEAGASGAVQAAFMGAVALSRTSTMLAKSNKQWDAEHRSNPALILSDAGKAFGKNDPNFNLFAELYEARRNATTDAQREAVDQRITNELYPALREARMNGVAAHGATEQARALSAQQSGLLREFEAVGEKADIDSKDSVFNTTYAILDRMGKFDASKLSDETLASKSYQAVIRNILGVDLSGKSADAARAELTEIADKLASETLDFSKGGSFEKLGQMGFDTASLNALRNGNPVDLMGRSVEDLAMQDKTGEVRHLGLNETTPQQREEAFRDEQERLAEESRNKKNEKSDAAETATPTKSEYDYVKSLSGKGISEDTLRNSYRSLYGDKGTYDFETRSAKDKAAAEKANAEATPQSSGALPTEYEFVKDFAGKGTSADTAMGAYRSLYGDKGIYDYDTRTAAEKAEAEKAKAETPKEKDSPGKRKTRSNAKLKDAEAQAKHVFKGLNGAEAEISKADIDDIRQTNNEYEAEHPEVADIPVPENATVRWGNTDFDRALFTDVVRDVTNGKAAEKDINDTFDSWYRRTADRRNTESAGTEATIAPEKQNAEAVEAGLYEDISGENPSGGTMDVTMLLNLAADNLALAEGAKSRGEDRASHVQTFRSKSKAVRGAKDPVSGNFYVNLNYDGPRGSGMSDTDLHNFVMAHEFLHAVRETIGGKAIDLILGYTENGEKVDGLLQKLARNGVLMGDYAKYANDPDALNKFIRRKYYANYYDTLVNELGTMTKERAEEALSIDYLREEFAADLLGDLFGHDDAANSNGLIVNPLSRADLLSFLADKENILLKDLDMSLSQRIGFFLKYGKTRSDLRGAANTLASQLIDLRNDIHDAYGKVAQMKAEEEARVKAEEDEARREEQSKAYKAAAAAARAEAKEAKRPNDTLGNVITKPLERKLKESKAKTPNGEPITFNFFPHGSGARLNPADVGPTYSQNHGDGYVMLASEKSDGNTPIYLRVRRPFEMQFEPEQVEAIMRDWAKGYYGLPNPNNMFYNDIKTNLSDPAKVFDSLNSIAEHNGMKTSELLTKLGYDGVHDGKVWTAFRGTQLVNPDGTTHADEAPTVDQVRYSVAATDEDYNRAVQNGDTEAAQKMVDEAARRAGYQVDSDYQGTSAFNGAAPSRNAYFDTKEERLEAWKNGEFEGEASLGDFKDGIDMGDLDFQLDDPRAYRNADDFRKEAIRNLRTGLQSKDGTITMYRSVPKGVTETRFRNGDWITPSRAYAVDNARIHDGYPGWENGYRIIEQKVPIENVWWDGNDIAEWGYDDGNTYAYRNAANNAKLLDPITYDDNGNVIPLSERFNPTNPDIRFSVADDVRRLREQAEKKGEIDTAEADVRSLKEFLRSAVEQSWNKTSGVNDEGARAYTPDEVGDLLGYASSTGDLMPLSKAQIENVLGYRKDRSAVNMPRKAKNGRLYSKFDQTILNSGLTPNKVYNKLLDDLSTGKLTFLSYPNKEAYDKAIGSIEKDGYELSFAKYRDAVMKDKAGADMTAMGIALYNVARAGKDVENMIDLVTLMRRNARSAAQGMQAINLLNKLSPEGKFYAGMREIQNFVEIFEKSAGRDFGVEIDTDLSKAYLDALQGDDRKAEDEAWDALVKDIAQQLPSSVFEKMDAWRHLMMLGTFRTQARNFLGNTGMAAMVAFKNLHKAALERLALGEIGEGSNRTTTLLNPLSGEDKALLDFAKEDFGEYQTFLTSGGKTETLRSQINDERRRNPFTGILKPVNKAVQAVDRAMEKGDLGFIKLAYKNALAMGMKARGITAEAARSDDADVAAEMDKLREYASEEAWKATYRDINAFSKFFTDLGKMRNMKTKDGKQSPAGWLIEEMLVESQMPYKKTPANLMVRGYEYSPAGLLVRTVQNGAEWAKAKTRYDAAVSEYNMNPSEENSEAVSAFKEELDAAKTKFADAVSAGLTGTEIALLGGFMRHLGFITSGSDPDEDKESYLRENGVTGYSFKLGDTYLKLDWLAPLTFPLFLGASLYDAMKNSYTDEEGNPIKGAGLQSFASIWQPILEMSMLSTLSDTIDTLSNASKGEKAATLLSQLAVSYLGQFVPSLGGQIENAFFEPVRDETYTAPGTSTTGRVLNKGLANILNKIPGVDWNQTERYDWYGRTDDRGGAALRALNSLILPGTVTVSRPTDYDEELLRLHEYAKMHGDIEGDVFPKRISMGAKVDGVTLSKEEYEVMQRVVGEENNKLFGELFSSDYYKNASDETKIDLVKKAISQAKAVGRAEVNKMRGTTEKEQTDAEKIGIGEGSYMLLTSCFNSAETPKGYKTTEDGKTPKWAKMLAVLDMKGVSDKEKLAYINKQANLKNPFKSISQARQYYQDQKRENKN